MSDLNKFMKELASIKEKYGVSIEAYGNYDAEIEFKTSSESATIDGDEINTEEILSANIIKYTNHVQSANREQVTITYTPRLLFSNGPR